MNSVTRPSRRDSRCDIAVSHGCPDPTRPDPKYIEVAYHLEVGVARRPAVPDAEWAKR